MSVGDGMRTNQLREAVERERAKKLDLCSTCGVMIDGAMIGTGDGTMRANGGRGSFAHVDCYRGGWGEWRDHGGEG